MQPQQYAPHSLLLPRRDLGITAHGPLLRSFQRQQRRVIMPQRGAPYGSRHAAYVAQSCNGPAARHTHRETATRLAGTAYSSEKPYDPAARHTHRETATRAAGPAHTIYKPLCNPSTTLPPPAPPTRFQPLYSPRQSYIPKLYTPATLSGHFQKNPTGSREGAKKDLFFAPSRLPVTHLA